MGCIVFSSNELHFRVCLDTPDVFRIKEQAAFQFGIRENTASVRLARLRKGLREYLTERGFHL